MTGEERLELLRRLLSFQAAHTSILAHCEAAADAANEAGAKGLAMATLMLREAMEVYKNEMVKFIQGYLDE